MTRSFGPNDQPKKRKPAPSTPEHFRQRSMAIQALLQAEEADELFEHLYALVYENLKGQSYEPRVTQMDSDATQDIAADLEDEAPDHIPGPHQRDASACRSADKDFEDALRLIRSGIKTMKLSLGVPVARRGRPAGWMKTA